MWAIVYFLHVIIFNVFLKQFSFLSSVLRLLPVSIKVRETRYLKIKKNWYNYTFDVQFIALWFGLAHFVTGINWS